MTYEMPNVEISDSIAWHVDGVPNASSANAAIVTGVHPEHIDLTVFFPGRSPAVRMSVRHVSDPKLSGKERNEFAVERGGWDYSPFHKMINAITKPRSAKQG